MRYINNTVSYWSLKSYILCAIASLFGSSIQSRGFVKIACCACDYSHVRQPQFMSLEFYFSPMVFFKAEMPTAAPAEVSQALITLAEWLYGLIIIA